MVVRPRNPAFGVLVSPITHFLAGWVLLERGVATYRDKALVCLAGVAPDVDGLGIVIDFTTRTLKLSPTNYYQEYHRMLGHGLPAALVFAGLAAAAASSRVRVAALALLAVHLHLLCDVLGSRGTTVEDTWPVYYFAPLSMRPEIAWQHQWPLVGWENMAISAALIALLMFRATVTGYSPVALVSARADRVFVGVVRRWREQMSRRGSGA